MLMLRNMVSSLIEHEQIQTTFPKAKEAARLAEKLITLGKKGKDSNRSSAQSFLASTRLLPKVFGDLAERYKDRPGGYTRIYKYGRRPGDNAPKAILELVDGPRDTKFEMTARKVGWEVMGWKEKGEHTDLYNGVENGVESIEVMGGNASFLRKGTREDVAKVLQYRNEAERAEFGTKAAAYLNTLLVEKDARNKTRKEFVKKLSDDVEKKKIDFAVQVQEARLWRRVWHRAPGQVMPSSTLGSLQLAKKAMAKKRPWQLEKSPAGYSPLEISASKRFLPRKTIRVKTVEVIVDKDGERKSTSKIEEGRSIKEMPFRKKALPPKVQSALKI